MFNRKNDRRLYRSMYGTWKRVFVILLISYYVADQLSLPSPPRVSGNYKRWRWLFHNNWNSLEQDRLQHFECFRVSLNGCFLEYCFWSYTGWLKLLCWHSKAPFSHFYYSINPGLGCSGDSPIRWFLKGCGICGLSFSFLEPVVDIYPRS